MGTNEIVDSIYKAYGTDSGILFGIKEKSITKAIVEFTVNRIGDERQKLLDSNRELLEAIEGYFDIIREQTRNEEDQTEFENFQKAISNAKELNK